MFVEEVVPHPALQLEQFEAEINVDFSCCHLFIPLRLREPALVPVMQNREHGARR